MQLSKAAPVFLIPLLLLPGLALASNGPTHVAKQTQSSSPTKTYNPVNVVNCNSSAQPAHSMVPVSGNWTKELAIPAALDSGVPTATILQKYVVFSNGTLRVSDSVGASYVVGSLSGLPKGTAKTSLIANGTTAYQDTVVTEGGSVVANISLVLTVNYLFCQPVGLKVEAIGNVAWPSGFGVVSIPLETHPTFPPVARTAANDTIPYNPTVAYFASDLGFDWSDSKTLNPHYNAATNSIEYLVGSAFFIDPVTIATSTVSIPTKSDYQGHTCQANGRYWAFYNDGILEGWVSSTDGNTWKSVTTFTTNGVQAGAFAFYCSGTTIYYINAASSTGSGMYYRYGTLNSDGTITWAMNEGFFQTSSTLIRGMSTTVDSSGGWWAAFGSQVDTLGVEVWRCNTPSSCTWTQSTNFATSNNGYVPYPEIVPLSSGRMGAVWTTGAGTLGSLGIETYSSSAWSSQAFASGSYRMDSSTCVSIGTTVECGVASNNNAVGYITASYNNNSPIWSGFTSLAPCSSSTDCSASISTDGSSLFLAFTKSTTTAGYFKSSNAGSTWGTESDFSTSELSPAYVSAPLKLGSDFQVIWTACASSSCSSWYVRFAHASFYELLSCPSNAYLCWQFGGLSSNSNSNTVTSSCYNPQTGQTNCPNTPYCTTPSPCYAIQLNFVTTPCPQAPCYEQVVLHASPPGSSGPDPGYWFPIFEYFYGTQQNYKQEPALLSTSNWYTQGVTLAIYQNGTAFWGVEGIDGSKMTLVDNPYGTTFGTPNSATFEGANVGNSYGEYATFSTSSYYWEWVFTAPAFPTQHGCTAGVWYWGEGGPSFGENSNLC